MNADLEPPVHTENCTLPHPRDDMTYCLDCACERANEQILRERERTARQRDAAPELYELLRYVVDCDMLVERKAEAVALLTRIDKERP